ncbi:MAG: exodeoxyribonuclease VII large subunit [Actinobacteria bacterium]|nr:exodeoxyribonuclease VII large subunit [Actinomycetota bacterium]
MWAISPAYPDAVALQTSPENPAPLHVINGAISTWVARLGAVWVEGQVTQINARPGMTQVFVGVRDVKANLSAQMVTSPEALAKLTPALTEGDRIVMRVKAEFWANRGQLVLRASEVRAVGLGDLLARIERLKQALTAEGLFAANRKQSLPFLPRRVGLICGRDSAAEHDVVTNARRRWPSLQFELRTVAVQGPSAAAEVTAALAQLCDVPDVDVIVIARGGGNAEDLLPFSDEALIRAVAACRVPVVSAIGHEQDSPLLDFVADVRASTPTDAARRVVPDVNEQRELIATSQLRTLRAISTLIDTEGHRLARLAAHPGLQDPMYIVDQQRELVTSNRIRFNKSLAHLLQLASTGTKNLSTQLRAFSPAATLERGYAIVFDEDAQIVRDPAQVGPGDRLRIRLADGDVPAIVTDPQIVAAPNDPLKRPKTHDPHADQQPPNTEGSS